MRCLCPCLVCLLQAGGSAPQRKRGGNGKAAHSWFKWPHTNHNKQQQQQQQHQAQPDGLDATTAASTAAADGDVLRQLPEQQRYTHSQQWPHVHGYGHDHMLPPSRCMSPSRAVSVKPSFALPIDDLRLPNRWGWLNNSWLLAHASHTSSQIQTGQVLHPNNYR